VAAELTGDPSLVDGLLEALPRSSGLMLAGPSRERLTVDYYANVHIKGLRLLSGTLDADSSAVMRDGRASRLERTRRLLARPERAAACSQVLQPEA
jgi:hypothetical protein